MIIEATNWADTIFSWIFYYCGEFSLWNIEIFIKLEITKLILWFLWWKSSNEINIRTIRNALMLVSVVKTSKLCSGSIYFHSFSIHIEIKNVSFYRECTVRNIILFLIILVASLVFKYSSSAIVYLFPFLKSIWIRRYLYIFISYLFFVIF